MKKNLEKYLNLLLWAWETHAHSRMYYDTLTQWYYRINIIYSWVYVSMQDKNLSIKIAKKKQHKPFSKKAQILKKKEEIA